METETGEGIAPRKRDTKREWKAARKSARARRKALVNTLGSECVECGERENLHFDHPNGRTWEPRRLNGLQRMRMYERDHAEGNLRLLCNKCNGHDGAANARRYAAIKRGDADGFETRKKPRDAQGNS